MNDIRTRLVQMMEKGLRPETSEHPTVWKISLYYVITPVLMMYAGYFDHIIIGLMIAIIATICKKQNRGSYYGYLTLTFLGEWLFGTLLPHWSFPGMRLVALILAGLSVCYLFVSYTWLTSGRAAFLKVIGVIYMVFTPIYIYLSMSQRESLFIHQIVVLETPFLGFLFFIALCIFLVQRSRRKK